MTAVAVGQTADTRILQTPEIYTSTTAGRGEEKAERQFWIEEATRNYWRVIYFLPGAGLTGGVLGRAFEATEKEIRHQSKAKDKLQVTFACLRDSLFLLGGLQYLERAHQGVVDAHHRASVVKLPAIIGSAENRHELATSEELIAIFHHLMSPANQVQVVSA